MATNTALTYRLQGIPRAYNRHDTQDLACRLLSVDKSKVSVRSLALHPLKCDSKIATLSLLETPATVAPKPKTSVWSFREPDPIIAGKFLDFTLDTHFHGFTPLHDGEDEQCNIDMIALSGLNGHAFGSFKAKGLDFMWIRDALAKELPGCRLFIYGYDTTMVQSTSHQSILDLGSQLASSVEGLISATTVDSGSSRSLIFLGHSLGGLVVEQALVELSSHVAISSRHGPILQKVTGVLLFGVPQKGMSVEALITMVNEQPNRDLVASLSIDSAFLQLQQSNFQKARLEMSNARVVAFFETQETPTVQQNALGKWEMSGPSRLLVSKTSATSLSDTTVAVNRNHSEIVKFQPNDADYDRVLSSLRLMRGSSEKLYIEAKPPTEKETEALQSLGFLEQHWRRDEISPGEDTCEWLSENPTFQEWFRNPVNPELRRLWIRGHPGSGKSTLMKYAWEFLTRRLPASVTLASFFFHARGTSLQQKRMGLLRSILHQLAFRLSEVRSCLMRHCDEKRTVNQMLQWSEGELQQLIRKSLTTCKRRVCILVDALDEAGKQTAEDLVKWFGRLTNLPDVRVIFSCRYYPVLPTISKFAISMENENATDIDRVVRAELRSEFNEGEAQVLENDIIQKANGMFQWAILVTNSVVEKYREMGQSIQSLRTNIRDLPSDLHDLYDSLLSDVKDSEKKQTIKLLIWTMFADRPLNPSELQHALVIDEEMKVRSVSEFRTSLLFVDMERAIKTLSRGLAEFKSHGNGKTAQFIHQSVVDYLKEDGLAKLLGLQGQTAVLGHAQRQLSRSCIRYLLMKDLSDAVEATDFDFHDSFDDDFHEAFPFAEYALHFWIVHTINAELYGIDQKDLLDMLPWTRMDKVPFTFTMAWADCNYRSDSLPDRLCKTKAIQTGPPDALSRRFLDTIDTTSMPKISESNLHLQQTIRWNNREFSMRFIYPLIWDLTEDHDSLEMPLNLFALAGINSVWQKLLAEIEDDPSLYRRKFDMTGSGELSLLLAILLGNPGVNLEEIPESLIKAQVNDAYHVTPLFLAVIMQREDLVRAFIRAGAEGNVICDDNVIEGEEVELSIFELAILIGNVGIMRQLIDAYGPTPNDKSAMNFAIRHGSNAVFDMLVDQCSSRYTADEFINFSKDEDSQTPLQTALSCGKLTRCRKLVDAGADVENSADGSPLLLWYIDEEDAESKMLEFLLECGADPNRGPPEWPTPLMSAMYWIWIDAIQVLLNDRRTDPNLVDKEGLTGLMQVLRDSHDPDWRREAIDITQLCASSGRFDMEIKDPKGETVLTKAVTTMRSEIVDILLTNGKADPNTRSACGWTPLMRSAFLGYWTITKLLLSCANIDIEAQDSWGKTALYYAIIKGKVACANLILGHEQTDLQSLKAPLSSACFEAAEQGEKEFLAHLPDVRPMWFGHYLMSEIYNRAQRRNRRCIIRRLEEAGFRLQEDIVMTDAS